MGRRLLFPVAILLLLLITLYFYINYSKLKPSYRNFEYFQTRTKNVILTVWGSQSSPRLTVYGNEECLQDFNLHEIEGDLHNNWQNVGDNFEWYVYSAYADHRLGRPLLRILTLSKGSYTGRLFCRIWYNSTNSSVVETEKRELWIHAWDHAKPGQYLHPFLLTCPTLSNPSAVSVLYKPCQRPENLINIKSQVDDVTRNLKDFVVCLKPLNFDQNVSFKLLEWLELQFLLGADKVFVYVYNVHPLVRRVLKHYEDAEKVALKIHSLPSEEFTSLANQTGAEERWQKRRHEMIIYNDCLYRHIDSHRFVANLDLDEAIVPVLHESWSELLENASATNPKLRNSASISARNVYFFDSFGASNISVPPYMHMLRHVYRSANFSPPGFAQKSFYSTNLTLTASNHFALQALRPQVRILSAIGDHLVRLHHYRKDCPPLMEKDCDDNYMKFRRKDTTLWRYKDSLVRSVRAKAEEIGLKEPSN